MSNPQEIPDWAQKYIDGQVLLLDKPLTWTSFNLVQKVKVLLKYEVGIKKIKVGHAGTLDPLATGLMIVCTGKATKQITALTTEHKEYVATIKFGQTTASFDLESEPEGEFAFEHISEEKLKNVLEEQFSGKITQVPPLFSAKWINGKRAYEYARKGQQVEIKSNEIEIFGIEVLEFNMPVVKLKVSCSKGTYIRSLANDIGKALGSGSHLIALHRTKIGNFNVDDAYSIEDFEKDLNKA